MSESYASGRWGMNRTRQGVAYICQWVLMVRNVEIFAEGNHEGIRSFEHDSENNAEDIGSAQEQ